ncbi:MAG TPA: diguanylate cyclase [Roseateles sp.]|nr:diguanylate cyclase [Roseateles sp.]
MRVGTAGIWIDGAKTAGMLCTLVLAAALLGIMSRPMGQLASLWPANALLLGLMVRSPARAGVFGWAGAAMGYLLADMLTGSELATNLLLTGGNLAGVLAGQQLLSRLPPEDRRLQGPLAVPRLLLVIAAAAATAGLVGFAIGPRLLGSSPFGGWVYCFVSELANYIAFLPAVLTLPDSPWRGLERRRAPAARPAGPWPTLQPILPVLALIASCLLSLAVPGPGAVAFPVPALLWCALSYGVFGTALLTLLFGTWALVSIAQGLLPMDGAAAQSGSTLLSIRLGISLIAVAPITVACVMAARNKLLLHLQHLASHDPLSGLLNRHSFHEQAGARLRQLAAGRHAAALLMLDLDHFKQINDVHGHAAGDEVLRAFARLAGDCLREVDLMGRVGGEEFAILLPGCSHEAAQAVAERVRAALAAARIDIGEGRWVSATVSIGIAVGAPAQELLEPLLVQADLALYRAKTAGRNRLAA